MSPFFTIITSTYNAAATLPRLLDSLASQTCRDFNWIVQDGSSSDATMQIVEQYRDRLPEILANSSKDSGIYDAWNKAIDRWRDKLGEWILFLGADDTFSKETTLEQVKKNILSSRQECSFFAGDIFFVTLEGEYCDKRLIKDSMTAFKRLKYTMPINHSALFTQKNIILTTKFDSSFKIAGDYDFILKTWRTAEQLSPLHLIVTHMAQGGISGQELMRKIHIGELFRIVKKTKSFKGMLWCLDAHAYGIKCSFKRHLEKRIYGNFFWRMLRTIRKFIFS